MNQSNNRGLFLGACAAIAFSCNTRPDILINGGLVSSGGGGNGSTGGGGTGDGGDGNGTPIFSEPDGGVPVRGDVIGNVVIHQRDEMGGSISLDGGTVVPGGDSMLPDVSFPFTPTGNGSDVGCGTATAGASILAKPVDIIVSVDNSNSMATEIVNVQQQLNDTFSAILADSGIDYRVIMVTRYGWVAPSENDHPICIGPPLGAEDCTEDDTPTLTFPAATAPAPAVQRFFHYSADVNSNNMWCILLDTFAANGTRVAWTNDNGTPTDSESHPDDDFGLGPDGWQAWLRPDSFKMFIGITDDHGGEDGCEEYPAFNYPEGANDDSSWTIGDDLQFTNGGTNDDQNNLDAELQAARDFDRDLRALSPEHFGSYDAADPTANRNYRWYSIVAYDDGTSPDGAGEALGPNEPLVTGRCDANVSDPLTGGNVTNLGEAAGIGYQYLSQLSGALRFPSCYTDEYDAIFNDVAQGVQDVATVPCEFPIDLTQIDGIINPSNVTVTYDPSTGNAEEFTRVDNDVPGDCAADNEFYFEYDADDQPSTLILCPETCGRAQADQRGNLQIDFGCLEN